MSSRPRGVLGVVLSLLLGSLVALGLAAPAQAAGGNDSVALNPSGGARSDATDGVRFVINAQGIPATQPGQDVVHYAGLPQWCCSAGAPMLSVGGELFGSGAGPSLNGGQRWSSVNLVAHSGDTSVSPGALSDGSVAPAGGTSEATMRYTAVRGGLDYLVDRTVTYTYPNNFATDSYTFTIPAGNTDAVRFYLAGDTAPGGSDQGYGVMLTSPVRSVISLNTSSRTMFGFREVAGSRPFDGARTASFFNPTYQTVWDGGDLGFVAEANNHDAGLAVQWNLGTEPGVVHAALEQFVTAQGTNLNAKFDRATSATGRAAITASIENTELTNVDGLAFTLALPAGLSVDGPVANDCGGTVSVPSRSVVLTGGAVGAATNCVVTVPVRGAIGSYGLDATSVTGLSGTLVNSVGASSVRFLAGATVEPAPTASLAASANKVRVGDKVTLTWSTAHAAQVTASGPWSGALPASGRRTVRLDEVGEQLFRIAAANATGKTSAKVAVAVLPEAKRLDLTASVPILIPGRRATVNARGFEPGEKYVLEVGGVVVARGRADAKGNATITFTVPAARKGSSKVVITGALHDRSGVAPAKVAGPKRFRVRMSQSQVRASDPVRVRVGGMLPRERVRVVFENHVVARGRANAAGRFTTTFTVGETWGPRTARVVGTASGRAGVARFTVVQRCFVQPRICS